jgi:hypothetical protein
MEIQHLQGKKEDGETVQPGTWQLMLPLLYFHSVWAVIPIAQVDYWAELADQGVAASSSHESGGACACRLPSRQSCMHSGVVHELSMGDVAQVHMS